MRIILNSNSQIIEVAMEKYARLIFTICYSMTSDYFGAEDLTQDTFLAAYKNLNSFDGENMKAWLTTIASNKCRDYLKSATRRSAPTENQMLEQVPDKDSTPEDKVLQNDLEKKLEKFCESLKEPYKATAIAYFCRCLSAQEISKATGKNLKTTQTHIYRAKAMMRKLWKEEFG